MPKSDLNSKNIQPNSESTYDEGMEEMKREFNREYGYEKPRQFNYLQTQNGHSGSMKAEPRSNKSTHPSISQRNTLTRHPRTNQTMS